jgi:hypothetical protein
MPILLLFAPEALAPCGGPKPPSLIFINQSFSWVPIVIGVLQSLLAIWLTYYIFRSNAKQKIAERKATWFHKVAVDPSIEQCFDYFSNEISTLNVAALDCEALKYRSDAGLDTAVKRILHEFRTRLRPIRNGISDLTLVFDLELRQEVFNRFNQLEDDVTGWFDKLQSATPVESRESLPNLITGCQSDVLKLLREYEFKTWAM